MTSIQQTRSDEATSVIRLEHLRRDDVRLGSETAPGTAEAPTAWSPIRSGDNVVPFVRPRHGEGPSRATLQGLSAEQRSATSPALNESRIRMASLVTLSLAAHLGFFMFGWSEVEPLNSVGVETISIEIVLGGDTVAGVAEKPADAEAEAAMPVDEVKPEEQIVELKDPTTQEPQDVPVAEREAAPEQQQSDDKTAEVQPEQRPQEQVTDVKPDQRPEEQVAEARPDNQTYVAMVETPTAEIATVKPQETPADMNALITPPPEPRKVVKQAQEKPKPKAPPKREVAPERTRIAARTAEEPQPERAAPPQPKASSGVGVGRSANDPNYRAMVAAHLQRFKQYPAEARAVRAMGSGRVTFSLNGSGQVTSVSVAGRTGVASLDAELAAMVRRANPFPKPPNGQGMTFSVPVSFRMQ